jgi:hypothetical protein
VAAGSRHREEEGDKQQRSFSSRQGRAAELLLHAGKKRVRDGRRQSFSETGVTDGLQGRRG